MSMERLFHWICDSCKKEEIRADYGLPKDWVAIKSMNITQHACSNCKEAISKHMHIIPQIIAKR